MGKFTGYKVFCKILQYTNITYIEKFLDVLYPISFNFHSKNGNIEQVIIIDHKAKKNRILIKKKTDAHHLVQYLFAYAQP